MYEGIYADDLFFLNVDAFSSCFLKIKLFIELWIWRELLRVDNDLKDELNNKL